MDSFKSPRFWFAILAMGLVGAACFVGKISGETMVGTIAGLLTGTGAVLKKN